MSGEKLYIQIKNNFMIKNLTITALLVLATSSLFAGGLLTNTNQSVHFLRNPARDASTEIDAVYTNPAGVYFSPMVSIFHSIIKVHFKHVPSLPLLHRLPVMAEVLPKNMVQKLILRLFQAYRLPTKKTVLPFLPDLA